MASSAKHPPSSTHYDLLIACTEPGCPVCRLSARSVKRYLENLFYESVNDPGTRDNLLKSLGFCSEHVNLLLNTRIADGLGASIIYENIVKVILREFPLELQSPSPSSSRQKGHSREIKRFISASSGLGPCIACEQRDASSERALHALQRSLGEEKLRLALQGSDGLCFPHLAQLLDRIEESDHVRFLLKLTRNKLKARGSEMAEFVRKNDHRFRSEGITREEALAWRKAMCMISGASITLTGEKHD